MKTWKLVSAIISILIGAEILNEGSKLHSLASAFSGDTTYVFLGILAGVFILAGGIVTLVARSTGKIVYDKVAVICYVLGFVLCFMGPNVWEDLYLYSIWAIVCAVVAVIGLYKKKGNKNDGENKGINPTQHLCKKCPNCGAQMNDDSLFCTECGSKIPQSRVCPHCGASINDVDAFCQNCGKKVDEIPSSQSFSPTIPSYDVADNTTNYKKIIVPVIVSVIVLALIGGGWYYNSIKTSNEIKPHNKATVVTDDSIIDVDSLEEVVGSVADEVTPEIRIQERVEYIFNDVYLGHEYDADSKWLTTEYNKLIKEEREVSPEGEVGFIDSDHWIQGQDCDKPSMTIESVDIISDSKAIAKIKIKAFYNSDYATDVKLVLKYEREDWYIDDFISYQNSHEYSEKEGLKRYISSEKKRIEEVYENSVDSFAVAE